MTDHTMLKMHLEKNRIADKEMISAILSLGQVATVALHDDPYPYEVAMNYGFEWKEKPVFYFHMATEGHRVSLLRKNPKVAVSIYEWLDRLGYDTWQHENHDYRSVHAYGSAEIITIAEKEEYLKGLNLLQTCNGRKALPSVSEEVGKKLFVMRVEADYITAKAKYPVMTMQEVLIPENVKK